ncbi:family 1 glycosylhydrolase [Providencia vermicola]
MGNAIAANQAEGAWNLDGKGPSVADAIPIKSNLRVTDYNGHNAVSDEDIQSALNGVNNIAYPKRKEFISITVIKMIWPYLVKWGLK